MQSGMLLVFVLFGVFFAGAALVTSALLRVNRPNPVKNSTYECGIETVGDAVIKYNLKFYVFALLYVIFAVESAFLFPWAVVYRSLPGWSSLSAVLVFLVILVLSLAYAWSKGALKWD
jgi:NADH-quinone oxidoreductase subunit A